MPRYKAIIEYDGTDFAGMQRQENQETIQGLLEKALYTLCKERATIYAAGRTDAGVHALKQVIHFDLKQQLPEFKIADGLNAIMRPKPISLLQVNIVDENFHARFSAKKRYYKYIIINRRAPLAIETKRAWHVIKPLDVSLMKKGAKILQGKHDFSSFRSSECQAKSSVKTIDYIEITQQDEGYLAINIRAKSFLHHMVRNIVGTLVYLGFGKFSLEDIKEILAAKDRSKAGPTAPAHGLYFVKVDY